jgi:hypothetical protein
MALTKKRLIEILSFSQKLSEDEYGVIFESLKQRMNAAGIPVLPKKMSDKFGWDGTSIRILQHRNYRKVCDLAHEFGHWLVCPPDRRHVPEFGLGAGFSTSSEGHSRAEKLKVVTGDENVAEEIATCFVAAFILFEIGADVREESEMVLLLSDDNELYNTWADTRHYLKIARDRGAFSGDHNIVWPNIA